ncbi:MAG: hypothetical protein ABFS38_12650 [Bacteroidota bacterium]
MRLKDFITILLLVPGFVVVSAQEQGVTIKINDIEKVTSVVKNATTSSSTDSGDFSVYQSGTLQMKKFSDYYMILVRHDLTPSDPNVYISVELVDRNDQSVIYEMAKYMRVSGTTDQGPFSIKVKDINAIEVVHKLY